MATVKLVPLVQLMAQNIWNLHLIHGCRLQGVIQRGGPGIPPPGIVLTLSHSTLLKYFKN